MTSEDIEVEVGLAAVWHRSLLLEGTHGHSPCAVGSNAHNAHNAHKESYQTCLNCFTETGGYREWP